MRRQTASAVVAAVRRVAADRTDRDEMRLIHSGGRTGSLRRGLKWLAERLLSQPQTGAIAFEAGGSQPAQCHATRRLPCYAAVIRITASSLL